MEKDIKLRVWIDEKGVQSLLDIKNLEGVLTVTELGLLVLEIERNLKKLKVEYFAYAVHKRI